MEPLRWMKRWQKRLRSLVRTSAVDRELDEELAFHLEMETRKHLRAGMTPQEASREAKLAFGALGQHRGDTRDARWLAWFPDLSMDFKLGGRMLVKYPGLTLVGGLAMAFGIWAGAVTFEMVTMLQNPRLGLPESDRIVQLRNYDVQERRAESRSLHDFLRWRESLRSVSDLGAYRDIERNLEVRGGDGRPVQVAEISASAFLLAPTKPLLGRTLSAADERAGAPPVAVVGYEIWRSRFASDSAVVGRSVQIGGVYATVVGVMPEGFAFPVSHELWMPLRVDGLDRSPRVGPAISMFARLAPGATLEEAQTELALIGRRTAAELPQSHQNLQPQLLQYAKPFDAPSGDLLMALAIPGFAVMLLVLVCGNVALLLFARAATRENELIVRSALGASRARIVVQLFAEALVLGGIAAAIGLAAADFGLRRWGGPFLKENMGTLPFWYQPQVSAATVLYAIGLTLLAAVVAGVLPALKVTSGMGARLRQTAAGAGGLKFGGVWTAVIITQVAFTTAFPALVFLEQRMMVRVQTFEAGFPTEQYLAAFLEPGDAPAEGAYVSADVAREKEGLLFQTDLEAVRRRVLAHPAVMGVAFIDRLPREGHRESLVELDEAQGLSAAVPATAGDGSEVIPKAPLNEVQTAYVDASYLDLVRAPALAGRLLLPGDLAPESRVVVVDQGFVDQVLLGRNAVGRRVRFAHRGDGAGSMSDNTRPWYQIVGVVKELGMGAPTQRGRAAGVYMPVVPGVKGPTNMMLHVRGDPLTIIPDVRAAANAVNPTLRLPSIQRVDQVTSGVMWVLKLWMRMTVLLTAIALLLSLAGIYAVLSFTVSRRTREIGIRVALGANARRVVVSLFKRPLTQVGIGVAVGGAMAGAFLVWIMSCQDGTCTDSGLVTPVRVAVLVLYLLLVLGVCLLACIVPTRRALAVEPLVALRAE
ncbi:MAG TPA: ABC transporter permease [Gemmatimonas sp.]|nr:ABC transporter permease [Gemmatimonas sp.]